jgi:hypothetical protein
MSRGRREYGAAREKPENLRRRFESRPREHEQKENTKRNTHDCHPERRVKYNEMQKEYQQAASQQTRLKVRFFVPTLKAPYHFSPGECKTLP